MRGASEFEKGAESVCPQGTPITRHANNEAHNNGKYGLRIFTGLNHNGEGLPGFYPRKIDSCAPVSAKNPFVPAEFKGQFSWRNGHNGITFGSVAAIHIVDAVLADNVMRGIEGTAADGVKSGTNSMTQLRGPWGANKLIRPTFIGHAQEYCPLCDHTWKPVFAKKDAPSPGKAKRLGLATAASWGLTVENATFINYDRIGLVAVSGFAKAVPPGAGYDFRNNGGSETRFSGTKWVESNFRVQFRWQSEFLITDLDGTFSEQPFCAGCHVLHSPLLISREAFPDCYMDERYSGSICTPKYNVVLVGLTGAKPCGPCFHPQVRLSYRDPAGIYVKPDDAQYLQNKWRPEGSYNLVELDVATDEMQIRVVGEHDTVYQAAWNRATAIWLSKRRLSADFYFLDSYETVKEEPPTMHASGFEAVISTDGTTLTWVTGADVKTDVQWIERQIAGAEKSLADGFFTEDQLARRLVRISELNTTRYINSTGARQLFTNVVWYNCELLPHKCARDAIRYPELPHHPIARAVTSEATIKGNVQ